MAPLMIRPCLLTLAVTLAVIGQSAVTLADTTSSTIQYFDLPAASLGDSLSRLSRESGRTLSVTPALLQGRRAPALRGQFSPEQAARSISAALLIKRRP